jgi:uncharacterized protein YdbL (DUF1318 family)
MLSEAVKASYLACALLAASATAATADDNTAASTGGKAPAGLLEQVEEDAKRAADKATEIGERAGESAEKTATTVADEAEDIFERAKQGGRKAYEWSKQQLEKLF